MPVLSGVSAGSAPLGWVCQKSEAGNRRPGANRAGRPAPAGAGPGAESGSEMPCRSANRAAWKYAVLAVIFLAWLAFLIWVAVS